MKKQYILAIAIIISLVIISIIWFIFYKNYEIKQKEFIFEKNKECLSYKDKMENQFLKEHNNLKTESYEMSWINYTNSIVENKIDKIYYNKKLNTCLFEVSYEEMTVNDKDKITNFHKFIEIYDYLINKKINDFNLWCDIFEKWELKNNLLDKDKIPPCADIDFKENWRKSYNEWQKNNN